MVSQVSLECRQAGALPTTLMVKSFPRKSTAEDLAEVIIATVGPYVCNLVYVPWDHNKNVNAGYAFVNFVDSHEALRAAASLGAEFARISPSGSPPMTIMPAKISGIRESILACTRPNKRGKHKVGQLLTYYQGQRVAPEVALSIYCDGCNESIDIPTEEQMPTQASPARRTPPPAAALAAAARAEQRLREQLREMAIREQQQLRQGPSEQQLRAHVEQYPHHTAGFPAAHAMPVRRAPASSDALPSFSFKEAPGLSCNGSRSPAFQLTMDEMSICSTDGDRTDGGSSSGSIRPAPGLTAMNVGQGHLAHPFTAAMLEQKMYRGALTPPGLFREFEDDASSIQSMASMAMKAANSRMHEPARCPVRRTTPPNGSLASVLRTYGVP
mmetsp:Transcript_26982/g.59344  ORF Transcript_26982/g.59344 Transcript_26982/m.59344 type:complete len:385 (-) Transcript_26982:172-1326(-)